MLHTCYSCQILMKPEFSQQAFKNTQSSDLMKVHPVITKMFCTDPQMRGQTNMTKLT